MALHTFRALRNSGHIISPASELRSCVKVEAAVLGSLIVRTVSVDVMQH